MTLDLRARALLFDMDGTLVDSTAVVERVWVGFAQRYGLDAAEVISHAHGRLTVDTVEHFLPDQREAARAVAALDTQELDQLEGIVEIPGAADLLRALAAAPLAVITSAARELAHRRMAAAGVPVPEVLVSAEDVSTGKPSPEGYLGAARALGVAPADCLVFEDAEAGIRAGLAAGARVVVVGGHRSAATQGLPRIPDFRGMAVHIEPEGVRLRRS